MSQSLSQLYVHIIFHVKDERMLIRPEEEKELYAYIGGIIKKNSSRWIKSKNRYYEHFAWQGGYAGFSVSQSLHARRATLCHQKIFFQLLVATCKKKLKFSNLLQ